MSKYIQDRCLSFIIIKNRYHTHQQLQHCHSHITTLSFTYKNVVYHIRCQQSMSVSIKNSIDTSIDKTIDKYVDIVG